MPALQKHTNEELNHRLVCGSYRLLGADRRGRRVGARPDGDSVWFHPDRDESLRELPGGRASFHCAGCVQLRLEGIDALELHFDGGSQPRSGARKAREFLLSSVGCRRVAYASAADGCAEGLSVREALSAEVRGRILTRYSRGSTPASFALCSAVSSRLATSSPRFDREP